MSAYPPNRVTARTSRPVQLAVHAGTDRVDAAADLVARHDRHRRQVWIDTQAAHDVGKIDAGRFDANANFAGFGFGIGRLFDFEDFRRAGFRDPNLPHGLDLRLRTRSL